LQNQQEAENAVNALGGLSPKKSQPQGLATLLLLWKARLENQLSKAEHHSQSNEKYSNYDPHDDLHCLPLRK
jgi:hypothetical protein